MIRISHGHARHNEEPKLYKFASLFENPYSEDLLPYYEVEVEDSCWSNLFVSGSLEPRHKWINERFYNSPNFVFAVESLDRNNYYQEGEQLSIELRRCDNPRPGKNSFAKYTGTPEECATKMKEWIAVFMSFAYPKQILPEIANLMYLFENPFPEHIPYYEVKAKMCEHFGSTISIKGSLDPQETWSDKRLENSRCFAFSVTDYDNPYYRQGDKLYVTPLFHQCKIFPRLENFHVHIATPEECAQDLKEWLRKCISNQ